ncbi:MAG: hypothetical protein P8Y68_16595 [Anaerolineales bacterium]
MSSRKYKDDYKIISSTDERGREKRVASYLGNYYEVSLNQEELLKFKRLSFLLLITAFCLHLAGGFVDNQGMYQFFISLPYVIAFFPMIKIGEAIFRIPTEKRGYRRDEKELSFDQIKTSSYVLIGILGIGLIGEIVFLLLISADGQQDFEYRYLLLELVVASCTLIMIRLVRPITFQIVPGSQEE